ncbi:MAG: hypothetical protein Q7T82_07200 [Armatimonadota bacterium]|nr:hypothetical protein [Armatimonadota bacterium]
MEDERKPDDGFGVPWVSLWMVLFSIGIIYLIFREKSGPIVFAYGSFIESRGALALAILTLLVALPAGAIQVIRHFYQLPFRIAPPNLDNLVGIYLEAWKTLWRHRWIPAVFGAVALISAFGALLQTVLIERLASSAAPGLEGPPGHSALDFGNLVVYTLGKAVVKSTGRATGQFFLMVGHEPSIESFLIISVVFVGLALWLGKRIKALRSAPELAAPATLVDNIVLPLAIAFLGVAIVALRYSVASYSSFKEGRSLPDEILWISIVGMILALCYTVVTSLLVGGIVGSFKRLKQNKPVTGDSFLRDVIRYFNPALRVYTLLWVIGAAMSLILLVRMRGNVFGPAWEWSFGAWHIWSLALPVFMFLPYAYVVHKPGTPGGLRLGIRDWFAHPWQALSFVAVGFTFLMVVYCVSALMAEAIRFLPGWAYTATDIIYGLLLGVLVNSWMAVAVWEFYWQLIHGRSEAQ